MNGKPVAVLGAGGHALVVIDALRAMGTTVAGLVAPEAAQCGASRHGVAVLGTDAYLEKLQPEDLLLASGVGSVSSTERRALVYEKWCQRGFVFAPIVHPSAHVSPAAELGSGAQVMAGAVVQAGSRVGDNVLINTRACVDHECTLRDHVHVASGAVLCGAVTVRARAHVGAGAVIIQGITIGEHAVVGAGAVVVRDVPDGARAIGVPARW